MRPPFEILLSLAEMLRARRERGPRAALRRERGGL